MKLVLITARDNSPFSLPSPFPPRNQYTFNLTSTDTLSLMDMIYYRWIWVDVIHFLFTHEVRSIVWSNGGSFTPLKKLTLLQWSVLLHCQEVRMNLLTDWLSPVVLLSKRSPRMKAPHGHLQLGLLALRLAPLNTSSPR